MAAATGQILNGQRFVIAEDEAMIALLLEDAIERSGGKVLATVSSCDQVFEALNRHVFDAIILDVHLQGGTSEDVVAAARDKNIAVLVCTGSAPHTLAPAFRDLPLLSKPWRGDALNQAMTQLFVKTG